MTTEDVLQRAPKGWKKRRHSDYVWIPSKSSEFDNEKSDIFAPEITIGDPTYSMQDSFDEKERSFEEGAYLTLSVDNIYFVENEESKENLGLEKKTKEFLDIDEDYEFVVQVRNLTLEEAKRKAKNWMQKIQSEEDLADFIQEKKKVLYGIDTFDIRHLGVSEFEFNLDGDEEISIGRTNNLLFLCNDKEAVKKHFVDKKVKDLEEEAERKKKSIDETLSSRKEFVKSLDQKTINFD